MFNVSLPPFPPVSCFFPYHFMWLFTSSPVCLCVVDTVLLSTTSSLCSRPTTGPPSVFVFPTFTLNSSSLSTTSWSGTVLRLIPLPQHIHLAPIPMEHACVHLLALGSGKLGGEYAEWLNVFLLLLFFCLLLFSGWNYRGRSWDKSLACTRNASCLNKLTFWHLHFEFK